MKNLIADYAAWVVGVSGAGVVLWAGFRRTSRRLRWLFERWNIGFDTLVGRDAITHPDTGAVLVEATPSLGNRLATIEGALVSLSDTQEQMADMRDQITNVVTKVAEQGATLSQHVTDSIESNRARSEEQRAMWDAIKAVAESRPPAEQTTIYTERSV